VAPEPRLDARIDTVEVRLSATDPAALLSPPVLALIVTAVKDELARDRQLEARREADRSPVPSRRRHGTA
jgi:hypothetical protein